MYNLLLIILFSYLVLHLIDNGVQGPELNWNFGLFFRSSSLLNMGRKLVLFHLPGDSPSCCDLSEEVESSLVKVLSGSFTPLRWVLWGCLRWRSVCPRGQQQKRHEVPIFCPQVSSSTKTVCPHLLLFSCWFICRSFCSCPSYPFSVRDCACMCIYSGFLGTEMLNASQFKRNRFNHSHSVSCSFTHGTGFFYTIQSDICLFCYGCTWHLNISQTDKVIFFLTETKLRCCVQTQVFIAYICLFKLQ